MVILIKNGFTITPDSITKEDILIRDGFIAARGEIHEQAIRPDRVFDVPGCYICPGAIDPHVHMQLPTPMGRSSDDFFSGGLAALMGGTTTMIDFVTPEKGQFLSDAIASRKRESANCPVDYSFHVSPIEWRDGMDREIRDCIQKEGLKSFKVYMAYKDTIGIDDEVISRVMEPVAEMNGIVLVHAEMDDEISGKRNLLAVQGKLSPRFHAVSRPAIAEARAIESVIKLGEQAGCPLYIVHVSSGLSLPFILSAQNQGLNVYAETCPQYLLFDDSRYGLDAEQAIRYVMSPPLRKKNDNRALWNALSRGILQTVGTDHCPFTLAQKSLGLEDFRKIPGGVGGVEHRLSLLYTYGVLENRLTLQQWVAVCSTNPAKIFGLYPAKGSLEPGADADIVVWDPLPESRISVKSHHQQCDNNIYEGIAVRGKPVYVFTGGILRVDNGRLTEPGYTGKFLRTHPF